MTICGIIWLTTTYKSNSNCNSQQLWHTLPESIITILPKINNIKSYLISRKRRMVKDQTRWVTLIWKMSGSYRSDEIVMGNDTDICSLVKSHIHIIDDLSGWAWMCHSSSPAYRWENVNHTLLIISQDLSYIYWYFVYWY